MIKAKLDYADTCLKEIKFLIDRQGRDLQEINGSFYWVDKKGITSQTSVSKAAVIGMVEKQVLEDIPYTALRVATPVYLLAIGCDPRAVIMDRSNLDNPDGGYLFNAEVHAFRVWGPWHGYAEVWHLDS